MTYKERFPKLFQELGEQRCRNMNEAVLPRFNNVADYESFLKGDRSKVVERYVVKEGQPTLNPDYDKAPYGLSLTLLGKPIDIVDG